MVSCFRHLRYRRSGDSLTRLPKAMLVWTLKKNNVILFVYSKFLYNDVHFLSIACAERLAYAMNRDCQFTASSTLNDSHAPHTATKNSPTGWAPGSRYTLPYLGNDYLQVSESSRYLNLLLLSQHARKMRKRKRNGEKVSSVCKLQRKAY